LLMFTQAAFLFVLANQMGHQPHMQLQLMLCFG